MNTEAIPSATAADFGKRIGALSRAARAGQNVEPVAMCASLDGMIAAPASTALDALALAAAALKIAPVLAEEGEGGEAAAFYVESLLARIVTALEAETGTPASAFTGDGPSLN